VPFDATDRRSHCSGDDPWGVPPMAAGLRLIDRFRTAVGAYNAARRRGSDQTLRRHLIGGATGSGLLRAINVVLLLGSTLLLTRALGPAGYGIYAQVISTVALLGMAATPGVERLLTRSMSVYQVGGDHQRARGLLIACNVTALALSLLISAAACVATWLIGGRAITTVIVGFWVGYLLIPLNALSRIRAAAVMGLRHVVAAQFPEFVLRPVLTIGFVAILSRLVSPFTATVAVTTSVAASALTFIVGQLLLYRVLPDQVRHSEPAYEFGSWMRSAMPLFLLTAGSVVGNQVGVVLLGLLATATESGLFAVANQGASFISFGLIAASTALAPVAARLWANGESVRLQRVITLSTRAVVAFSLPAGAVLIVFAPSFLGLFGTGFREATGAFQILCMGQMVNAATGSVSTVLTMTGQERAAAAGVGISAILTVLLDLILIPIWGLTGAAVGGSAGMIVYNLILMRFAQRRLGLRTSLL
jgi:O-antigen/teichoic acid export membrane protein